MKYIIGSGWWSIDKAIDTRDELFGDDLIRSKDFHNLWYEAINRYSNPEKIIIVDSNSPIKPNIYREDSRLEFISLNVNAGHSTNHIGKFCGCVRAMLMGLEFTRFCEADYYIYIEQDALIYGRGVIEYCISKMTKPYMFGTGVGTHLRTQQSLFIIRQDAIWAFIENLQKITQTDNELCPEEKFHIACCHGPAYYLANISEKSSRNTFYKWLDWQCFKFLRNYDDLPIGYGRVRPINFNDPFFYFQQGNQQELKEYLELTGFNNYINLSSIGAN